MMRCIISRRAWRDPTNVELRVELQGHRYANHQDEAIVRRGQKIRGQKNRGKSGSESRTLREEIKMSLTRRQALASAAAAIASTVAKPAIAAKEPIIIFNVTATT